jgi:alpha-1,3-glucosyltransferase
MILPPCTILFFCGKNSAKEQQSSRLLLKQILLGATACALAFFLAGFQVHEKSILFSLAPISLLFMEDPKFTLWFSLVAVWTLFPLMILDKLQLAYFGYCILYLVIAQSILAIYQPVSGFTTATQTSTRKISYLVRRITYKFVIPSSAFTMILLHLSEKIIRPPPFHLPDLFPVLWSITGCAMFLWSYVYCLVLLCEIFFCLPANSAASLLSEESIGNQRWLSKDRKKKDR